MLSKMRWTIQTVSFDDDDKYIGKAFAGFEPIEHPGDLPLLWRVIDGDGNVYFDGECDDFADFDDPESCFCPQDYFSSHGVVCTIYRPADGSHGWKLL